MSEIRIGVRSGAVVLEFDQQGTFIAVTVPADRALAMAKLLRRAAKQLERGNSREDKKP